MRLATGAVVAILVAGMWGASQTKSPGATPPAATKPAATASKTSSAKKKPSSSKNSSAKKSSTAKRSGSKSTARKKSVPRQTQPDAGRSREIQSALKTQGYLNGEPTGKWDAATSTAFAKYQHDHGVKATGKPDARSLINLGLGPKYDNQIQLKPPAQPN
jgi:peptidoglycan hydrolase-like protein with peptidoglycan-binding domain